MLDVALVTDKPHATATPPQATDSAVQVATPEAAPESSQQATANSLPNVTPIDPHSVTILDALTPGHPRATATTSSPLPVGTTRIEHTGTHLKLTTDISRTCPLLWTVTHGNMDGSTPGMVVLSPTLAGITDAVGTYIAVDTAGRRQFAALSYTLGTRTLLRDVHQIPGGATVTIDLSTGAHTLAYSDFPRSSRDGFASPEEASQAFNQALDASMEEMLRRTQGRRLVLPLSGGLDSRLLIAWLRRAGVENVLTFTYGRPGAAEVQVSRRLAESCGYPWVGVDLVPDQVRQAWASPEAADFIRSTWLGASLPHIQDWYALRTLLADGTLTRDDVILPGHTVIGNLHDEDLLAAASPARRGELSRAIVRQHANLDNRWREASKDPRIGGVVEDFLRVNVRGDSPQDWADAVEVFNVSERQAKYINHSMLPYSFFDLGWDLPMLDAPMWDFAARLPLALSEGRNWYRDHVNAFYSQVTGIELATHVDRRIPASVIHTAGRILGAIHLKTPIERVMTSRFVMKHPLGLDLYAGQMSPSQLNRLLLGGFNITGVYSQQFIRDQWNPHIEIGLSDSVANCR